MNKKKKIRVISDLHLHGHNLPCRTQERGRAMCCSLAVYFSSKLNEGCSFPFRCSAPLRSWHLPAEQAHHASTSRPFQTLTPHRFCRFHCICSHIFTFHFSEAAIEQIVLKYLN